MQLELTDGVFNSVRTRQTQLSTRKTGLLRPVFGRRRMNPGAQLAIRDIGSVDSTSTRRGLDTPIRASDWSGALDSSALVVQLRVSVILILIGITSDQQQQRSYSHSCCPAAAQLRTKLLESLLQRSGIVSSRVEAVCDHSIGYQDPVPVPALTGPDNFCVEARARGNSGAALARSSGQASTY